MPVPLIIICRFENMFLHCFALNIQQMLPSCDKQIQQIGNYIKKQVYQSLINNNLT